VAVEGLDAFPCQCAEYSYTASTQTIEIKIEMRELTTDDSGYFPITFILSDDSDVEATRERTMNIIMLVTETRDDEYEVVYYYGNLTSAAANSSVSSN